MQELKEEEDARIDGGGRCNKYGEFCRVSFNSSEIGKGPRI